MSLQEFSGQQQTSSSEHDLAYQSEFASSEFREEGTDFREDRPGSGEEGAANRGAAGESHIGGKRSLFEDYKDPTKQFTGQTRSYHQDPRYNPYSNKDQDMVHTYTFYG